jgi:hypothetical protein
MGLAKTGTLYVWAEEATGLDGCICLIETARGRVGNNSILAMCSERGSWLGLKMIGNNRRKAPPLSILHFLVENESDTILSKTRTVLIFW